MKDRFVLIGHPVGHSVSPVIHQTAYELLGREGNYELLDCPTRQDVVDAVTMVRDGRLLGANVTVPWKQVAYELCDEHSESARRVGVANVLVGKNGRVTAHNTDATALADELTLLRSRVAHRTERPGALVIGNGGAARAAVVSCLLSGISDVAVTARRFTNDKERASWPARADFENLGARVLPWLGQESTACGEFLETSHLIVQATSAGMKGTTGGETLAEIIPWKAFGRGAVYDLVYNPPLTPVLARAAREGCETSGGLGMLVGQAAHAIELWWGELPEQAPLLDAARKALGL